MLTRAWLVGALLPCLATAQSVSVGVTGGVPISPHSQNYGPGCFDRGPLICGPNDFFVKPYSIGPIVGVNLRWGISAEVGFLYERFHQDLAHGLIAPTGAMSTSAKNIAFPQMGGCFPCCSNTPLDGGGSPHLSMPVRRCGILAHSTAKASNWTSICRPNRLRFISKAVEAWTSLLRRAQG